MANRIFVCAVVALWLGSMSWLMVDKILPSYWNGERPIAAGYENNVPVGWRVSWGDRQVGHAVSVRIPGTLNTTNVESQVKLTDVPLLDLVPPLMRHVVGEIGSMKFEAKTRLEFDSLDNFTKFESSVSINDITPVLRMVGAINGSFLELNVAFGEVSYKPKVPISDRGVLSEALFPDAKLPFMYTGRRWQEEVYNPFSSPSAPIETLDVEVTGVENIDHEGEHIRAFRVESLAPAVTGVPESARLQSVAWVKTDDGTVLRQDVFIANSKLRFERMSSEDAAAIHAKLEEETRAKYRQLERGPGSRHGGEHGYRPGRRWYREQTESTGN
jgi:hypothetical protein